jgi:hypothetical protein
MRAVRQQLGRRWASNPEFGTRLHAEVTRQLNAQGGARGWNITTNQALRTFGNLPAGTADMTVAAYLQANPHLSWLRGSLSDRVLNSTVGDLRPDLAAQGPGGRRLLWDLTSRSSEEHLAKSTLYSHILSQDNTMTRTAETYWIDPNTD